MLQRREVRREEADGDRREDGREQLEVRLQLAWRDRAFGTGPCAQGVEDGLDVRRGQVGRAPDEEEERVLELLGRELLALDVLQSGR